MEKPLVQTMGTIKQFAQLCSYGWINQEKIWDLRFGSGIICGVFLSVVRKVYFNFFWFWLNVVLFEVMIFIGKFEKILKI
jgi:hypothetical protein